MLNDRWPDMFAILGTRDVEGDEFSRLTATHPTRSLFLVSALGLFLELALIRWIGTEVRIFAYLQNTILVVCFMGLGMGCLTCRKPIQMRGILLPLLAISLLMAIPFTRAWLGKISEMLSVLGDFLIWANLENVGRLSSGLLVVLGLGMTFVLMVLVWDIFVPVGRLLGRLLDDHPSTIWAYSVNVAGSLVGIWLFVFLSAFDLPPVSWFAVVAALVLLLIGPDLRSPARRLDLYMVAALRRLLGSPVASPERRPFGGLPIKRSSSPNGYRPRATRLPPSGIS